jgi:(p)ppGpp synthase/HD superfamily hydrolase
MSERAFDVATKAHSKQFDKAGKPYIEHVMRVAASMPDEDTKTVAYLHDVVEDTGITIDEIYLEFGRDIALAVSAITKSNGESYADFIKRVSKNNIARTVKKADLNDNLDLSRLQSISKVDKERAEKYRVALMFIEFAESLQKSRVLLNENATNKAST